MCRMEKQVMLLHVCDWYVCGMIRVWNSWAGNCGNVWAKPVWTVALLEVSDCRTKEPTCYHSWTWETVAEWRSTLSCCVFWLTVIIEHHCHRVWKTWKCQGIEQWSGKSGKCWIKNLVRNNCSTPMYRPCISWRIFLASHQIILQIFIESALTIIVYW